MLGLFSSSCRTQSSFSELGYVCGGARGHQRRAASMGHMELDLLSGAGGVLRSRSSNIHSF